MTLFLTPNQWYMWSIPSKLTFIASLGSVLGLVLSLTTLFYIPGSSSTDIQSKIKELDNIQVALATLNNYVGNQQQSLKEISREKSILESEKDRIQTALKIDKEKLDALLEYQLFQQKRGIWIELFVSFLVGVLSSSVVTFSAIRIQENRRKKADAENT